MLRGFRIYLLVALSFVLAGCGAKQDVPKTPDAAVVSVAKAMADNHPETVFNALPASYQADIDAAVREAAGRMDADVWNGIAGLLGRTVKILDSKSDVLLETRYLAQHEQKEMIRQNWDHFVSTMSTFLESDFADLEALRAGDVGRMLAGSGGEIMKQVRSLETAEDDGLGEALAAADKLATMAAVLVSQDGETATVKVEVEGEDPDTIVMVRVEDKWIPKDFADGFSEGIAEMRKSCQEIDFTSEKGIELKKTIMSQVSTINTLLVQAESAETPEEMNGVINGIVLGVMGAVMGGMMGM